MGRQLVLNTVDVDSYARAAGMIANPALPLLHRAVIIVFDVIAASTSLCHQFLFLVLQWLDVPLALLALWDSMYRFNPVFKDGSALLFVFLAGILQGDPVQRVDLHRVLPAVPQSLAGLHR